MGGDLDYKIIDKFSVTDNMQAQGYPQYKRTHEQNAQNEISH
jgi:hypothetical protein